MTDRYCLKCGETVELREGPIQRRRMRARNHDFRLPELREDKPKQNAVLPGERGKGMRLGAKELLEWAAAGGLTPFDPNCINPASVDLRWSGRAKVAGAHGWSQTLDLQDLILGRGEFFLLDTMEYIRVPDGWAGMIALKSSLGRSGLEHLHAGFFDPGFEGTATLEVENRAPFPLTIMRGQRIIQLIMDEMKTIPEKTYKDTGRYGGQRGPTECRP